MFVSLHVLLVRQERQALVGQPGHPRAIWGDAAMLRRLALLVAFVPAVAGAEPPGDALPPGAVARLGSYRFYHGGGIEALAAPPDGPGLATSGPIRPANTDAHD